MQVKIICEQSHAALEDELNKFLAGLADDPTDIKVDIANCSAVVHYSNVNPKSICCECKFWDDGGKHDELMGLCQRCGGRKRFNAKACNKYEDVRG